MIMRMCLAVTLLAAALEAQTSPTFDIASLKLNKGCRGGNQTMPVPGHIRLECMNVRELISMSYGTFADGVSFTREQLSIDGLPAWTDTDRFDLDAKTESAAPVARMAGPMLRALLEDRFNLKTHRESKEVSSFALTIGKSEPKLKAAKDAACIPIDLDHLPQPKPGEPPPNFCGNMRMQGGPKGATLDATAITLAEFAQSISQQVQRPVVDKTGLTGRYDIHLEMHRDDSGDRNPFGPDVILEAIQSQLGLKIVSEKTTSTRLVVDSMQKLAEN